MRDFQDKVAVITGAGGGLGSALAEALAQRGCHLALVDISQGTLEKTVRKLSQYAIKISTHVADVTDKAQMAALPDAILGEHGKINILINNAGITIQKSFATHTMEDWEKIVGINWWGLLYGCHFFLPALEAADEAHIVNLSSMSAFVGLPGQTSYCATKGAVKLLSESMWAEMDKLGIGVTSVHPGAIKTEMIQATLQNSDDVQGAQRNYELAQRIGVTADHAAQRIVRAIEKKKLRIRIGKDAVIVEILKRLMPVGTQKLLKGIA